MFPAFVFADVSLTVSSHLRESGSDDEAAEAEEERGEALALQTLHQHAHLRRHRYEEKKYRLFLTLCWKHISSH